MNCERCYVYLSDRDAKVMSREHVHARDAECIANLRAALEREEDRARRVARVFWRIRDQAGIVITREDRWRAFRTRAWWGGKVYRVTVRRVKKVRA